MANAATSTKLGNLVGYSVRGIAHVADYYIPLTGLAAYRLIPEPIRAKAFGGPSTSKAAMQTLLTLRCSGWTILQAGVSNHPDRPTPP